MSAQTVAVVGGGPAGLMAAEVLAGAGCRVSLHDAMPSVGRKFLLAGKGGLNLTHSEAIEPFVARYGTAAPQVARWLERFGPDDLRRWAESLGVATFIGSSGRVFPVDMKAAPLLRAWLHRLRAQGVAFHMRERWVGWAGERALRFSTPAGERVVQADAFVLALGGASWPRLGSDGAWVPLLAERDVALAPLVPANCGFDVHGWSAHLRERFAGAPMKSVALRFAPAGFERKGEFVLTATGVEGSLVYAASAAIRDAIARAGAATVEIDLLPARDAVWVQREVTHPRGARSLSSHLKGRLGLDAAKLALLHEVLPREALADAGAVARTIKALPLRLVAPRPIAEAISSGGGVRLDALDAGLQLQAVPGVWCAGEMLDWEAPTGGYLLTASMASGVVAAEGVIRSPTAGA